MFDGWFYFRCKECKALVKNSASKCKCGRVFKLKQKKEDVKEQNCLKTRYCSGIITLISIGMAVYLAYEETRTGLGGIGALGAMMFGLLTLLTGAVFITTFDKEKEKDEDTIYYYGQDCQVKPEYRGDLGDLMREKMSRPPYY